MVWREVGVGAEFRAGGAAGAPLAAPVFRLFLVVVAGLERLPAAVRRASRFEGHADAPAEFQHAQARGIFLGCRGAGADGIFVGQVHQ